MQITEITSLLDSYLVIKRAQRNALPLHMLQYERELPSCTAEYTALGEDCNVLT